MKKTIIILLGVCCAVRANATVYTNDIPNVCGAMPIMMAEFSPIQYTCSPGYFLPAYTAGCVACPIDATCNGGTFYADQKIAQGIIYNIPTANTPTNTCSARFESWIAVYGINCSAGYYLPANSEVCTFCPADSYCGGGTYTFNGTTAQGITACPDGKISDTGSDDVSDCRDPAINCSPGYYLPSNASVCAMCLNDSYCVGGTYNLETNVPQGIVSCASGLFAPAGMWEVAQCGRILHVGDGFVYLRATKKTSPSLHLDLDHDGVADYFGNMTTMDVPMSRDTQRKIKVRYNNTTYSIYDDSVELPTE